MTGVPRGLFALLRGAGFAAIVALVSPAVTHAQGAIGRSVQLSLENHRALAPEIAVGPDGSVHVIWLDKGEISAAQNGGPAAKPAQSTPSGKGHSHQSATDLHYARSTDGARTFSTPLRVNREPGETHGSAASKPRVAVGPGGTVHILYPANEIPALTKKPLVVSRYVRSTDGGRTFSTPVRLNSLAENDGTGIVEGGYSQRHIFGAMSVARDGTIFTYWIDTRLQRKETDLAAIYTAVSLDDGVTFTPDRAAFPADICPCCQITTAAVDRNTVYVGARLVSPGNLRDSTVARSDDGGKTFAERVLIGGERWKIEGCPLKPTALAADGNYVYAAVYNGAEQPAGIYIARSRDRGETFSDYQPLHAEATVSDAPALAVSQNTVVAAWHAKTAAGRRVYYRTSNDRGTTFTPVQELSTPAGDATLPVLAAAADGDTYVAWQQDTQVRVMPLELPQTRVAATSTRVRAITPLSATASMPVSHPHLHRHSHLHALRHSPLQAYRHRLRHRHRYLQIRHRGSQDPAE